MKLKSLACPGGMDDGQMFCFVSPITSQWECLSQSSILSFTMTRSATDTWTLTNAKYLASKVTTDMLRCQQNYHEPDNDAINSYGTELALLLRDGYQWQW